MGLEGVTCLGCERVTYAYDACRGCGGTVCVTCWDANRCWSEDCADGHVGLVGQEARAMRWLQSLLRLAGTSPLGGVDVDRIRELSKQMNIAWRTLERAKADMSVISAKVNGQWKWRLPPRKVIRRDDVGGLDDPIPTEGDIPF